MYAGFKVNEGEKRIAADEEIKATNGIMDESRECCASPHQVHAPLPPPPPLKWKRNGDKLAEIPRLSSSPRRTKTSDEACSGGVLLPNKGLAAFSVARRSGVWMWHFMAEGAGERRVKHDEVLRKPRRHFCMHDRACSACSSYAAPPACIAIRISSGR